MELQVADYVLLVLALALTVLGAFRGLSGTVAFLGGAVAAVLAARFAWPYASSATASVLLRLLLVSGATLVAFGLVRIVISKCVRFLLAQPADAILGAAAGIASFLLVAALWAYIGNRVYRDFPQLLDASSIVRSVSAYVG